MNNNNNNNSSLISISSSTPTSSASSFNTNQTRTDILKVSLAQAEPDDDDLLSTENSLKAARKFDEEIVEYVDNINDDLEEEDNMDTDVSYSEIVNLNSLKKSIFNKEEKETNKITRIIAPEEKLSHEAKEYWATIDFYNNSKMAFNKRCKSVKLKREKLNAEMKQRHHQLNNNNNKKKQEEIKETQVEKVCTCVKCSILYHEAMIKGFSNLNEIQTKMANCKCCSTHSNHLNNRTNSTTNNETNTENLNDKKTLNTNTNNTNVKDKFEEKLFNIKNELVNLSETSLDVFQLLLQLSDTMLDLNNQLSSSTNANQLFLLNSNLNINQNFILYDQISPTNSPPAPTPGLNTTPQANKLKSNLIEDFLQKSFYSSASSNNNTPNSNTKNLNNSISNIINSINNRSTNQQSKIKQEESKKISLSPKQSKNCSNNPLIENLYDKTSVTQFVDSLLSNKDELSRASSGFYSASSSLLTMVNNEDNCNTLSISSESKINKKISTTTTTTNQILSKQTTPIKSSSSGGSASLCSSSNIDLSSLPSTCSSSTNIITDEENQNRHSTVSSSSSNEIEQKSPKANSVAGIAASFSQRPNRLGSTHTISTQSSSSTSPVQQQIATTTNISARKPSFKFENNTILNRVQNMNLNNRIKCFPNGQTINEEAGGDQTVAVKRNSLNRESFYAINESKLIRRQQSVLANGGMPAKTIVNGIRANHQMSLDSGIYLPSENEENLPVLI